uniref:Uncharacterized protein n=1 Tax=Myotis myotis TaxID=51298 RepID=A0A7J7WVQ0_MYOMY|nr:hypothetical protein mMyoMyo1_011882 [Myotis myotis]
MLPSWKTELLWQDCLLLLSSLHFSKTRKVNIKYRTQVLLGEVIHISTKAHLFSAVDQLHLAFGYSEVPSCRGGGGESQRIWGPGANAEERLCGRELRMPASGRLASDGRGKDWVCFPLALPAG